MTALAELTRAAEAATAERLAAEQHERQTGLALEQGKMALADAARRRLVLVDALEQATVAEHAGMDRLGQVRLAAASAERELERLGDAAALGNDAASRSLSKARDSAEVGSDLTAAHERRVAALRGNREIAQAAVTAHDLAEAARIGELYEAAIIAEAEHVDRLLTSAAEVTLLVAGLIDARRAFSAQTGVTIHEPHKPALLLPNGRHEAAHQAFLRAFQRLELGYLALGPQHPGSALGRGAREITDMWAQGRRPTGKAA